MQSARFYFNSGGVSIYLQFSEIDDNPFLNYGEYYYNYGDSGVNDVDCFLDHVIFENTFTGETFRPRDKGNCHSYSRFSVNIEMTARDFFELVTEDFLSNGTLSNDILMYFDDPNEIPLDLPQYSAETPLRMDLQSYLSSYVGLNEFEFHLDERIVVMHFGAIIYYSNVNVSKLSFSNTYSYYGEAYNPNNTVNISNAEILNSHSSDLTRTLALRISQEDVDEMMEKSICTRNNSNNVRNCFLSLEAGFAYSFYNVPSYNVRDYGTNYVIVTPPGEFCL